MADNPVAKIAELETKVEELKIDNSRWESALLYHMKENKALGLKIESEEKKYKELGQRLEGSEFHLKLAGDTIWRLERKLERVTAFAETLVETVEIKESELVELEEHCENRDQANQDLALANNWNNELIESLRADLADLADRVASRLSSLGPPPRPPHQPSSQLHAASGGRSRRKRAPKSAAIGPVGVRKRSTRVISYTGNYKTTTRS